MISSPSSFWYLVYIMFIHGTGVLEQVFLFFLLPPLLSGKNSGYHAVQSFDFQKIPLLILIFKYDRIISGF